MTCEWQDDSKRYDYEDKQFPASVVHRSHGAFASVIIRPALPGRPPHCTTRQGTRPSCRCPFHVKTPGSRRCGTGMRPDLPGHSPHCTTRQGPRHQRKRVSSADRLTLKLAWTTCRRSTQRHDSTDWRLVPIPLQHARKPRRAEVLAGGAGATTRPLDYVHYLSIPNDGWFSHQVTNLSSPISAQYSHPSSVQRQRFAFGASGGTSRQSKLINP